VTVLRHVFKKNYTPGADVVNFTMKDIREACAALGLTAANPADLVYRMKSRTEIPPEIQALGFRIIRPIGRGRYVLEKAVSTLIEFPDCPVEEVLDKTPLVVRRMLGEQLGDIDEQGLLAVVRYNDLISRFLGARAYHLMGHVRKSVEGVGQAEVDDVHVATPHGASSPVTIVPVEAKAKDEPINRAQIAMQILYARSAFPGHPIRALTIKLFETGELLFLEFADEINPAALEPVRAARYRLVDSPDNDAEQGRLL
jgi:hypothetical protein